MHDELTWEGIEEVERTIKEHVATGSVAYIKLIDRTGGRDDGVGRLDLLEEDDARSSGLNFELESSSTVARRFIHGSPEAAVGAALAWLRRRATGLMLGETSKKFQLRLMGPKGMQSLQAVQFTVRDPTEVGGGAPAVADSGGSFDDKPRTSLGETFAELARSMKALIGLLPPMYRDVLDRMSRMLDLYERRMREIEDERKDLLKTVSSLQVKLRQAEAQENADTAAAKSRGEVAKTALSELGLAVQAVWGRGVPPELQKLGSALQTEPELMAALKDPHVQEMLQDRANLQTLATMLKQGGQVHAASKQQTAPPGPPASPPASPPNPASSAPAT